MRIVQIANFYTPASGGLRTCVDEIGRGYGKAGHDRVLIVPGTSDTDESTSAGRRVTLPSPKLFGSNSYHMLTANRTCVLLDSLEPDVLEVSDKLSVRWLSPWARRNNVPLVLFSHERIDAILRSRVPRGFPLVALANAANGMLSQRAENIVVTSDFAAAEFARIGADNVRKIPLGCDLEQFRPLTRTRTPGDDVVRLVTVSRLSKEKRVDRSVAAVRLLVADGVNAELTILGDGPLRGQIERQAARLPVRFVGHVSDRCELANLVATADIALCPSPVETFGLAALEALACGTSVVVPRDGAAHESLGAHGSGVVTDGTPTGLAGGVQALLSVPARQRRSAARVAAERFPWSATVAGLLDLYESYSCRTKASVG
ncbi:glycosyltransferase [Antrihabitans spumae]|uniref:Glycosyltransferase n=1 Tax=Antrihabitans spumae TaxID=3373370 RepID=A0ABW7KFB9_9NOCA